MSNDTSAHAVQTEAFIDRKSSVYLESGNTSQATSGKLTHKTKFVFQIIIFQTLLKPYALKKLNYVWIC